MTGLADAVDMVVFDFDGTICESANVKTEAFYQLYLEEEGPDFAVRVRDYHLEYAGVSRFDKIKHIEEQMLGRVCSEERLVEVAARFGDLVRDGVIGAPLAGGVERFFADHGGEVPMLVASATPTDELRSIVASRGMDRWFDEVQGSPTAKSRLILDYLNKRRVAAGRAVMVGDQFSDRDAASTAGVAFVGYRAPGENRLFSPDVVVVRDFADLAGAIGTVAAAHSPVRGG